MLLAAAGEKRPVPKAGEVDYPRLAHRALFGLLEVIWLKGQAAEMGIVVTHAEVVRERELIKGENFASPAQFRRFLRESKFTRRDVYERVELQLLAFRIQSRIGRGADSEAEEKRAFDEFVAEFNERWRSRTVCAPGYLTARCSNGPEKAA